MSAAKPKKQRGPSHNLRRTKPKAAKVGTLPAPRAADPAYAARRYSCAAWLYGFNADEV